MTPLSTNPLIEAVVSGPYAPYRPFFYALRDQQANAETMETQAAALLSFEHLKRYSPLTKTERLKQRIFSQSFACNHEKINAVVEKLDFSWDFFYFQITTQCEYQAAKTIALILKHPLTKTALIVTVLVGSFFATFLTYQRTVPLFLDLSCAFGFKDDLIETAVYWFRTHFMKNHLIIFCIAKLFCKNRRFSEFLKSLTRFYLSAYWPVQTILESALIISISLCEFTWPACDKIAASLDDLSLRLKQQLISRSEERASKVWQSIFVDKTN